MFAPTACGFGVKLCAFIYIRRLIPQALYTSRREIVCSYEKFISRKVEEKTTIEEETAAAFLLQSAMEFCNTGVAYLVNTAELVSLRTCKPQL